MAFISTNMVPACISQAINFLTRPLILTQSQYLVDILKTILETTLGTCFDPAMDAKLTLTFSTSSLPPRPIFAACIACGLSWAEWLKLLSYHDFILVIEEHSVFVEYLGTKPHTMTVWSEAAPQSYRRSTLPHLNVHVPINRLSQQSVIQASLRATVNSPAKTRTAAQQLLESDHTEEDEIFAMISKSNIDILSPTPTREGFCLDGPTYRTFMPCATQTPEPTSSPDSSRPSSRLSTYSFGRDSISSASSVSSSDFKTPITLNNAPTFLPRQSGFVDNNKKVITKYLYQGGVSTVLTGGVMLGNASKVPAGIPVPKSSDPIGAKKLLALPPKHRLPGLLEAGSSHLNARFKQKTLYDFIH